MKKYGVTLAQATELIEQRKLIKSANKEQLEKLCESLVITLYETQNAARALVGERIGEGI